MEMSIWETLQQRNYQFLTLLLYNVDSILTNVSKADIFLSKGLLNGYSVEIVHIRVTIFMLMTIVYNFRV